MPRDEDGFHLDPDPMALPDRDPAGAEPAAPGSGTAPLPAPGAPDAGEPPRANAAVRLLAFLLDLIVLALLEPVILRVASSAIRLAERLAGHPFADGGNLLGALVAAGSTALAVAYFVSLHADEGQTLGKALLGIRVTRLGGGRLGRTRSAVRFVGYGLSALPLGLGFLGALASSRRALHDHLAGSVVVRA